MEREKRGNGRKRKGGRGREGHSSAGACLLDRKLVVGWEGEVEEGDERTEDKQQEEGEEVVWSAVEERGREGEEVVWAAVEEGRGGVKELGRGW